MRMPAVVFLNASGRVGNRQADLEAAVEDFRGPLGSQPLGRRNVLDHVVFQMPVAVDRLEGACHH